MADTKERKAPPQPKVKDILSSFEKGSSLQNGTGPKIIETDKPVAIPGGTKKLTAAYEKKNEAAPAPELKRKAKPKDEAPVENDVAPVVTSTEPEVPAPVPEVTSTSADSTDKEEVAPAPEEPATAPVIEAAAPAAPAAATNGTVLVVYADPERGGFNGAILDAVVELEKCGFAVQVSDLYRMEFNPLPSRRDAGMHHIVVKCI